MPVTCMSVVLMPSVAKGVRTQAWKDSPASRMGGLSGERPHLLQKIGRDREAFATRFRAQREAPVAGKAHTRIVLHRGDQRLDALVINVASGKRRRIDRDHRLPD